MAKDKKKQQDINVELSGMGFYGTTANTGVEGYEATGDIENAGHPEKGFKKKKDPMGARPTLEDSP
ncbi:MAG TPA: hypothetical protein VFK37_04570 [Bacillales bacterium]|nr:hypothetical protein [Bacillales bacterium]HEU5141241.1 hypothetical protein [Bacillales bacterium]